MKTPFKKARTLITELPTASAPVTALSDAQLRSVVGGMPCMTYNYEENVCRMDNC